MSTCQFSWRCGGLNAHLAGRPALASVYRHRYCEQSHSGCARYMLASVGPLAIPDDLLPNQHHRLAAYGVPVDRPQERPPMA